MSYRTQAMLARDPQLMERVAACAATQGIIDPVGWAWSHQWGLSAEPGWDAAYAYAFNASVVDIGNSDGVISDGMILAAVQGLLTPPAVP